MALLSLPSSRNLLTLHGTVGRRRELDGEQVRDRETRHNRPPALETPFLFRSARVPTGSPSGRADGHGGQAGSPGPLAASLDDHVVLPFAGGCPMECSRCYFNGLLEPLLLHDFCKVPVSVSAEGSRGPGLRTISVVELEALGPEEGQRRPSPPHLLAAMSWFPCTLVGSRFLRSAAVSCEALTLLEPELSLASGQLPIPRQRHCSSRPFALLPLVI